MASETIRLISWNVAGKGWCVDDQVRALDDRTPDIVALQEVTASTAPRFRLALSTLGLEYVQDTLQLAVHYGRRYGELIASRWPIRDLSPPDDPMPFPERVLSVLVHSPWGPVELHTVHIVPGVSRGWQKIEMFQGIYNRLARGVEIPRILCGDFNDPQAEMADGRVITSRYRLTRTGDIVIRGGRPEGWDRAIRDVLEGLAAFDLQDVYRLLHHPAIQDDYSWYARARDGPSGRRYDHVLASRALNPVACDYLHALRERGLSDHSAIEVCFQPGVPWTEDVA